MAVNKKLVELDARVRAIVDEEFADFGKYLPTPQDKQMYERKRKEYWSKVSARIKEELNDGRTVDDSDGSN